MQRARFNVQRYDKLEKFHEPDVLHEAQERIHQRLHNYLNHITEEKAVFLTKTPFLKELHPINGYPPSFVISRLTRINTLPNPPSNEHMIRDRISNIMLAICDPKAKSWRRAVAVENLRCALVTEGFKPPLVEKIRKGELRKILIDAVQNKVSRPLLEETCLTIMYIFYTIGTTCSRKTSAALARAIISELSHYLKEVTDYCDNLKAAKVKFLDKKLILGDKAKDLRFWFPSFRVKRAAISVHYASSSLLFYSLAFLLFHTRHMPVAFEIAMNARACLKPMRFYLLNVLDTSFGYFQYADLIHDPKLPKHIYNILSSLSQGEESSTKENVTKKMVVSCCRKLYALCQNTPLHFRIRQIDGRKLPTLSIKIHPEDSSTSSLSDRAETTEPSESVQDTDPTEETNLSSFKMKNNNNVDQ